MNKPANHDRLEDSPLQVPNRAVSSVRQPASWISLTPADLVKSVLDRWPSVIATTMLVTALVVCILVIAPNKYSSDGLIYVQLGRGALGIDPTAQNGGSSGVSVQETRIAEVLSVAEMINSREIAERVVNRVTPEEINRPRTWIDKTLSFASEWVPSSQKVPVEGMTRDEYDDQIDREKAVKSVQKWTDIQVAKNGYTVAIATGGPDALLVQAITQSILDEFKQYHVEAHRADGSLEFFEQQVSQSRDSAIKAREALQLARSEMGWMSVQSAETTLRERIINLEVSLDEAESDYAQAEQRTQILKRQLAETKAWIPTEVTTGIANAAGDSMRTELYGEQVQESEALAALKPDHPRFRLLQEKMTRSRQIVSEEQDARELATEALNPVRQRIESEFSLAEASAAGMKSKCDSLERSLVNARESLQRLNRDTVTLARLKWQADIDEDTLMGHSKSLEEARIIRELDLKNMSDVTIIQDASLNLKKIGPPRALLACVGVLLGLALGALQALLRDTSTIIDQQPIAFAAPTSNHTLTSRNETSFHLGHSDPRTPRGGENRDEKSNMSAERAANHDETEV